MLKNRPNVTKPVSWPIREGQKVNGRNLILNTIKSSNRKSLFYEGSEIISFKPPVRKEAVKKLLPLFLPYNENLGVKFFFAHHKNSYFGRSFFEAGLLVGTYSLVGQAYAFLWAAVNCEYTQFLGREILGIAKKMYDFEFDSSITGHCHSQRFNDQMLINWKEGSAHVPVDKTLGHKVVTIGGLMSTFLWQPIWHYHTPEDILEHKSLEVTVDFTNAEPGFRDIFTEKTFEVEGQWTKSNIRNSAYVLPIGFSGPTWAAKNFDLRYI